MRGVDCVCVCGVGGCECVCEVWVGGMVCLNLLHTVFSLLGL